MRVALFSTGDEIVEPGTPRPAAALYDANRYSARTACSTGSAPSVTDLGILKDDAGALAAGDRGSGAATTIWC